MRIFIVPALVAMMGLLSCNNFEYSPNQVFDKNSYRDINAGNLKRLGDGKGDDTVRFVLSGDTQRSRDETVRFTKKVNDMPGIDFVVIAGDITEFGVLQEMEWISRSLSKLNVPYVAVIGNHDLTSRGRDAFINMFGPLNYSFLYGGVKFVCHDTNSREHKFDGNTPDIPWLKAEMQPQAGVSNFVGISHVPPNSLDFDEKLVKGYTAAFAETPGFLASLHAHTHNYDLFYPDDSGIPYLTTSSMGNEEFILATIINHKISFERIQF
ncbi:metallophosphoesterase family protein [Pedobacter steynii]|uniref:Metallophosphoesterase n=1 Tax=Pedobacter steynii TaxID=430522 RepID=A0A1D7QMA3_9SPHI|nr:metallophosphoesterase [Pedobacter steynii]AOM79805.1 metallophosphoesterase [Pedobacter steynii]